MKKKKNLKVFNCVAVAVMLVVSILMTSATSILNSYASTLDVFLGKGERQVSKPAGVENWDTNYYDVKGATPEESQENSAKVVEQITDEGIVLLWNKNDALPLAKESTVSTFGYAYLNPIYGGYGSGSTADDAEYIAGPDALDKYFTLNDATIKAMEDNKENVVSLKEAPGAASASDGFMIGLVAINSSSIKEFEPSIYEGTQDSCKGSTGLVFIARNGSEGGDEKKDAYEDGTPHYLALTQREKETIQFAKANCDKVVVVLNSSNVMELSELTDGELEVDGIVWTGYYGARGWNSLAKVLCGEVNPSGKTVDIYPVSLTEDPTYVNFGDYAYDNATWINSDSHEEAAKNFVEYEEGIYIGYRFYETAAVEDDTFNYDQKILFPFGYGLSYTTFEKKIASFNEDGDTVTVTVNVKNTGSVAGKDVVQLYYTAPYTTFDEDNGIEKAAVNLLDFGKTRLLNPGEAEDITLTFAKEDMASYFTAHENNDGTSGCYFLEKGEYVISLRTDSHSVVEEKKLTIANDIYYDNTNPRQSEIDAQSAMDDEGNLLNAAANTEVGYVAATNQFQESEDYMNAGKVTKLTRADWKGTMPTSPAGDDFHASEAVLDELKDFDVNTDPLLGNVSGSKVYTDKKVTEKANNGLTLADLRGVDYYDARWDALLDQLDYSSEELLTLLFAHNYHTSSVAEIGKATTLDLDGPAGFNMGLAAGFENLFSRANYCSWCSEVVVASTWNVDLAYAMGAAVGQEGLTNNVQGWYGPGMNIHRSAFGGRNFEYYSEDPVVTGKMAAQVVSGATDNGVVPYIKHYALNEQETNRQNVSVWATEQTIREIYLKGYEMCIKDARAHVNYIADQEGNVATKVLRNTFGIMTSQSYIGGKSNFYHDGLLNGCTRTEWGFNGMILTDSYGSTLTWQRDEMLRAGGDMWFASQLTNPDDITSDTAKACMREAVHRIAYVEANNGLLQGVAPGAIVTYTMSPWQKLLYIVDAVLAVLMVALLCWYLVRNKNNGLVKKIIGAVIAVAVLLVIYMVAPGIAQAVLAMFGLH